MISHRTRNICTWRYRRSRLERLIRDFSTSHLALSATRGGLRRHVDWWLPTWRRTHLTGKRRISCTLWFSSLSPTTFPAGSRSSWSHTSPMHRPTSCWQCSSCESYRRQHKPSLHPILNLDMRIQRIFWFLFCRVKMRHIVNSRWTRFWN